MYKTIPNEKTRRKRATSASREYNIKKLAFVSRKSLKKFFFLGGNQ